MDKVQAQTVVGQVGRMNIAAISGGRVVLEDGAVVLPIGQGYHVRILLDEGSDTYTVQRLFRRAGKDSVKGERTWVYADEVGEVAYRASCYHHEW